MSTVMLETCREMKWINKYTKKCIRLVINNNPLLLYLQRRLYESGVAWSVKSEEVKYAVTSALWY